jgi:hypothetical protein
MLSIGNEVLRKIFDLSGTKWEILDIKNEKPTVYRVQLDF